MEEIVGPFARPLMDDRVFPFASFSPGLGLFSASCAEGLPRAFPVGFFCRLGVSSRDSFVGSLSVFLSFTEKTILRLEMFLSFSLIRMSIS